ncbi:carbamoyl phosphate synthase small subunit [Cytobacillus sp. S13-E01]|uniref:carbamoyl phosphate synthase small subunit n=1 Tax=Cytobacillus sp. S13-E01 TaxID=3031326 RepID=UPI0023D81636|nr:carbamoyl phosphate synthase small subunit [Cytobacillus sp. S13-E01]MDF0728594.1 carbamoyl phosphate synthase small subunit [Cytobacillus sp. S13-E01]
MTGYVHLENGECFEGILEATNDTNAITGEVVFFTGMTGYQEVLTDPSYKNQIVIFTYPLIGNYGINEYDFESSKPHVAGVIMYESFETVYHYEAKHSLKAYLNKWEIPYITHVDTRSVVKQIRDSGTMKCSMSYKQECSYFGDIRYDAPVEAVSTKKIESFGSGHHEIVVIDFGVKKSIVNSLVDYDCKVTVVPYNTSYETVKKLNPCGIVLSNGPGDPKQLKRLLPDLKKMMESFPTLAICLGHQLVGLAFGGDTTKLRFGHRGANQPVLDILTSKVFITSQNHSYVVNRDSLDQDKLTVRFTNVNDGSVEGLMHKELPILSVQYHPEAHPGPSDSSWIFHEFMSSIRSVRSEKMYA